MNLYEMIVNILIVILEILVIILLKLFLDWINDSFIVKIVDDSEDNWIVLFENR